MSLHIPGECPICGTVMVCSVINNGTHYMCPWCDDWCAAVNGLWVPLNIIGANGSFAGPIAEYVRDAP